ncbi:MAG: cytochrome c oxidase subunit II [Bacteroidia bacterium]|jgi:cytochrome c oxidase subunit 2
MTLLITISILLGILVLVRLMTIVQLSSELTGSSDSQEEEIRHNNSNGYGFIVFMVLGLGLIIYLTIDYSKHLLPVSASEHGVGLDKLLNINWAIIGIVFFITQIALFYFSYKYRDIKKHEAYFYPENYKLELIWTIVPTIVLTTLIITGLKQWNGIFSEKENSMNVQVYGYQFAWITRFSGPDNTLGKSNYKLITDDNPLGLDANDPAVKDDIYTTGNEMHIPLGQELKFQFNARDVIHSAYFPHFRAQMNLVPGMNTFFSFKPTITTAEMRKITGNDKFDYVLLCNKICGVAHYTMKMKVVVDTPADFKAWLKSQKKASEVKAAPPVSTLNNTANSSETI